MSRLKTEAGKAPPPMNKVDCLGSLRFMRAALEEQLFQLDETISECQDQMANGDNIGASISLDVYRVLRGRRDAVNNNLEAIAYAISYMDDV